MFGLDELFIEQFVFGLKSKRMDFSFCRYHLTLVCYLFGYGSSLLHIDLHTFHVLSKICKWVERNYLLAASEVPNFWKDIT